MCAHIADLLLLLFSLRFDAVSPFLTRVEVLEQDATAGGTTPDPHAKRRRQITVFTTGPAWASAPDHVRPNECVKDDNAMVSWPACSSRRNYQRDVLLCTKTAL